MSDRLGADVMVVPEGYDPHVDSILLSGKPSTFYLPDTALQENSAMREDIGIEQISPQTFLAHTQSLMLCVSCPACGNRLRQ